jgi:hypothetical protein
MQTLIAILAAALTLSFAQLGAASRAQAGDIPEFCKHRYNQCLSRCQMPDRKCFRGCQHQLQNCVIRAR